MSTKRNRKSTNPIGVGLTAKQMRRKKPIDYSLLADIKAYTPNQQLLFDE